METVAPMPASAELDKALETMPQSVTKGSAIFHHCCTVYAEMDAEASEVMFEGRKAKLYEGFLTKLFQDQLNFSQAYYSQVMAELRRMGCVQSIKRGGGTSPSRWVLLQQPTYEIYINLGGKEYRQGGPKSSRNLASMTDMFRDMEAKVTSMEDKYNTLLHGYLKLTQQVEDNATTIHELTVLVRDQLA